MAGNNSKHAGLLNALNEIQHAPTYAMRRFTLREAELLIVRQEEIITSLRNEVERLEKIIDRSSLCK